MQHCIGSEQNDFASSVVRSIPFILQMKQFSPMRVFSYLLQPALANSDTNVPLQRSLASIIGDMTCVLAGSCVYSRLENRNEFLILHEIIENEISLFACKCEFYIF